MWVHMHPIRAPVHPLNYINVYQVLAVNSLYVLFSVVFIVYNHS